MCYSAQIEADHRRFVHKYSAIMSLDGFARMAIEYFANPRMRVPRVITTHFLESSEADEEEKIAGVIRARVAADEIVLLQELVRQTERLGKIQQSLAVKAIKRAANDIRIVTNKIEAAEGKLERFKSTEPKPRDSHIYPGWYAPVMVMEGSRCAVESVWYQCRPAGKPAFYDEQCPGTYNAHHDNLCGFQKGQHSHTYGLILVDAFYEYVVQPDGTNAILELHPDPPQTLLVVCVQSHWHTARLGEKDLLSFATITDDPPPKVAGTGHDRCSILIKSENIDAWLNPKACDLDAVDATPKDKLLPFYTHRQVPL